MYFRGNLLYMIPFKKIALIGAGNVAYNIAKVLKNNGVIPFCIYTRSASKIQEIQEKTGITAVCNYNELRDCDLIIVAVKDDAIRDVSLNLKGFKALVVHTSGTQSSSLLNHLDNYGVMYPLQTFSKDVDVDFKKIPFLINASSKDNIDNLKMFVKNFSDVVIECTDENRGFIHMSAVYVSNFVNVMLQIGNKFLEEKGLDVLLLQPLVMETVNKSFEMGANDALTGPARRADFNTIDKHKIMLKDYEDEKKIYELLTNYIIKKYNK